MEHTSIIPAIRPFPMYVPLFVGYTRKAPVTSSEIIQVDHLDAYLDIFGWGFDNQYPLVPVPTDAAMSLRGQGVKLGETIYKFGIPAPGQGFYLKDCVDFYFKNGGTTCYVLSIGTYEKRRYKPDGSRYFQANQIKKADFLQGLALVKKARLSPPPGLLYLPDSLLLSPNDQGAVYHEALQVCEARQNLFLITDVADDFEREELSLLKDFSQVVSPVNGHFGAVFFPFQQTQLYTERQIGPNSLDQSEAHYPKLEGLIPDIPQRDQLLRACEDHEAAKRLVMPLIGEYQEGVLLFSDDPKQVELVFDDWSTLFHQADSGASGEMALRWKLHVLYTLISLLKQACQGQPLVPYDLDFKNSYLQQSLQQIIQREGYLHQSIYRLYAYDHFYAEEGLTTLSAEVRDLLDLRHFPEDFPNPYFPEMASKNEIAQQGIQQLFRIWLGVIDQIIFAAKVSMYRCSKDLQHQSEPYSTLMNGLLNWRNVLPPGSGVLALIAGMDQQFGAHQSIAGGNLPGMIGPVPPLDEETIAACRDGRFSEVKVNPVLPIPQRGSSVVLSSVTIRANDPSFVQMERHRVFMQIYTSISEWLKTTRELLTEALAEQEISSFLKLYEAAGILKAQNGEVPFGLEYRPSEPVTEEMDDGSLEETEAGSFFLIDLYFAEDEYRNYLAVEVDPPFE